MLEYLIKRGPGAERGGDLLKRILRAVAREAGALRRGVSRGRRLAHMRIDDEDVTRILVDELPHLAWTARPDGFVDFYNRRWYEYTGSTFADMEGTGWQKAYCAEDLPTVNEHWERAIHTGDALEFEARIRGADGVDRWFLTRARPVHDRRGRTVRWIGVNVDVDEQHRLRDELEAQSRVTRTLTENASGALFLLDAQQRCTFMNPAAEKMTGYSMGEVIGSGKRLHDLIHRTRPDGSPYPSAECPIDRAAPTRAREQGVDVFLHKDGHFYPVSFTASPILVAGRATGTVIEATDLSAAESREAWLVALIEGSPVGIAVFDRSLRYVRVNEALAKMNGLAIDAHVGKTIADVHPGLPDEVEAKYRHVVDTAEAVVDYEVSLSGAVLGGSATAEPDRTRYFQISIYPILVRGFLEGVVGMIQDITQRKREEQRQALLAKASQVFASSLDLERTFSGISGLFVPECADWASVYLVRDDGGAELATAMHVDAETETRFRERFETTPSDVREASPWGQALKTGRTQLVEDVARTLRDGEADGMRDWLGAMSDLGASSILAVPMSVHDRSIAVLTVGTSGANRRLYADQVSAIEEIARRGAGAIDNARLFELANRERRRADEANRAKDEFLAVVSHELRTPLNAILGWARMLATDSLTTDRRSKAIEVIERNAVAQAQLVEDLLDISRITTGKLRLEIGPLEIERVVHAAVESVTPAADAKGVTLVAELDHASDTIVGDASRIQQAIWNLLSNAVKFTPRGGRVSVRVGRDDARILVTIEDTGEGIDPELLEQIFGRFQQADMRSTRRHGGLGLGLAIARHIAELHGGTLEAASAGRGRGSTFRLDIPIAPARAPSALRETPPKDSSAEQPPAEIGTDGVRGLHLLVVDDDEDAREVLSAMLSECGAEVRTASSVAEALSRFDEWRPDALVSDIGMPGEDGYDLIEQLRSRPAAEGGKTPAIALTAYARTEDRSKALLAGFDAHVTKPVELMDLVRVIAGVTRARA